MSNMPEFSSIFKIVFTIVPILVVGGVIFTFAMIFSPKLRGKMMAKQIKATKHMFDSSKEDLTDLYSTAGAIGVAGKKKMLDENADIMMDVSTREAEIDSKRVETMARAFKKGFSEDDSIYCKHCGASIDTDSKFCKKCGKEQ